LVIPASFHNAKDIISVDESFVYNRFKSPSKPEFDIYISIFEVGRFFKNF